MNSSSITTDNDENKNKKKNFNKGMQIKQYYDNDLKISGEGFFCFVLSKESKFVPKTNS